MIIVHHLNASRSMRLLWLLEELGLEYSLKFYKRDDNLLAPSELKKIHPLGRSPILEDGKIVLAESGAIIQYLLKTYGKGQFCPPEDSPEYFQFLYWLHYSEGTLQPDLLMDLIAEIIKTRKVPFFIKPITKAISKGLRRTSILRVKSQIRYLTDSLGDNDWFVNNQLSAADIMLSYPIEAIVARYGTNDKLGLDFTPLKKFVDRIHKRPAFQRALKNSKEEEDYLAKAILFDHS